MVYVQSSNTHLRSVTQNEQGGTIVRHREGGGTFSYTRTSDAIDGNVLSNGQANYVNGAAGLISETRGGSSKFYHADALGSTRTVTNSSVTTTDTKTTDAFGSTWTAGTSGTTPTPFGFAGKHGYQSDGDTGLMLLGHRYYDASTGRFLSRDPIRDGTNWFAYCNNDPVNAVDPTGYLFVPLLIVIAVVVLSTRGCDPIPPTLPAGRTFPTVDEAAVDAIANIDDQSISENVEYGAWIVSDGKGQHGSTEPVRGITDSVDIGDKPLNATGAWHTHGGYLPNYDNENFSREGGDVDFYELHDVPGYVGTPAGRVKKYDPLTDIVSILR